MFEHVLESLKPFAEVFHRAGKHIYLVGGAVRNLLLGKPAQDYDFTTDALPEEVMKLFKRVIPTGIQHGTVSVHFQKELFEVTTFRVDGNYNDSRRPDSVHFTPSLEEDLRRRDFTINALAVDLFSGELYDFHGGRSDLEKKVLKAIGNPVDRFTEDALRILRLFRFAAQLDFSIDPKTLESIASVVSRVSQLSQERIRVELQKIQLADFPHVGWKFLQERNILELLFRGVEIRKLSDEEWLSVGRVPRSKRWGLTLVLWNDSLSVKEWEASLRSLTFSNNEIKEILIDYESLKTVRQVAPDVVCVKRWVDRRQSKVLDETIETIVVLHQIRPIESAEEWIALLKEIEVQNPPIFLKELSITGNELIELGYKAGVGLGDALRQLQELVWKIPHANDKRQLLEFAKEFLENETN